MRRWVLAFAVLFVWVAADEVRVLTGRGEWGLPFEYGARNVVMLLAAALCLARAFRVRHERPAWMLIGSGIAAWSLGDVYFSIVLSDAETVPVPSPADIGYLVFVPLVVLGVVLLARGRTQRVSGALLADGAGAALAVAAVGAAIVFQPVLDAVGGDPLEIAVNLAYPITDLALVAVVVGALARGGWRLDRAWLAIGAGALAFWMADSFYLVQVANETYESESWFDAGWTLGMLLFAWAAYQPQVASADDATPRLRSILGPLTFATLALGVLIYGTFEHVTPAAVVLAAASLTALGVRLTYTFRDNADMLAASRDEALTDALTGLGNRRALSVAVEDALDRRGADGRQWVLALFDLDGFKHYNDTFGHPSGDALLTRLGQSLQRFLGDDGAAFRMGGDEFCALIRVQPGQAPAAVARAAAALTEHGEGFAVTCSHGSVLLPDEAGTATEALRLADQRMYAHKRAGRPSPRRESASVLLAALSERHPELGTHIAGVAELADATARRLAISTEEREAIVHAAELHDVGKVAIPDAILSKPGPLDESEWHFIRQHTLVGERIAAAAPSLAGVGKLVRSSHERWDGNGYPDGLARHDIPLGARVIAVCDAFEAMTASRPYSAAMPAEEALAELRRCAGTQFDPSVVEAFCAVVAQSKAKSAR